MRGHGLHAVHLSSVLLPGLLQDGQVVSAPGAHLAGLPGTDVGHLGEETRLPQVTVQLKEGNVHAKPGAAKCRKVVTSPRAPCATPLLAADQPDAQVPLLTGI